MLHIHRAERADGLVGALGALLAEPPADPFAPEVVAVPTRGMERWLTQRLSHVLGTTSGRSDGICANVEFPSPRRLVDEAVAAASGVDPATDPWLPARAVWPLLEVVDECIGELWLQTLAAHLEGAGLGAHRFTAVRHLAELFDRYALHRPELVRAWQAGEDGGIPPDAAWQAELWRRLREALGEPSPAERLPPACARLEADPGLVGLPSRLALFGLTRLPAARLRVLEALAARRDVHLYLLHPSPALWERIAEVAPTAGPRRADDPTKALPANRLLASWGHDAREMQLVLAAADAPTDDHHHPTAPGRADTLLARIQADIRHDRRPPEPPPPAAPDDRSIQVHACHGRARQVEVLRDAILHLLREDPTLEPRDIVVMCPDIETFAPLIHATFGAAHEDEDGRPDLRVRLADRSLRQTNPVLGATAHLLDLAGQRLTASQVLDLADREPVRRRFRLDDDDLTRIEEWVSASGIRWGLDAAHRAPFQLHALEAGTWRAGLDRILAGVTMSEDQQRLVGGRTLPLDDVESGAIDLAGRFAELVDRLHAAVDALSGPQTIDAWADALAAAADALTAPAPADAWQRAALQRLLDDVVAEASANGSTSTTELTLPEVRALLADRLQGRPTRANFRTGHLTICTLMPMRSVPHRVVCLLGMDDAHFPRRTPRDGDDLLLRDPHVGERDPRSEDRQLLLDALLAARDRLLVTYTGNDERTNAPRPPAVPIGELLDMVERAGAAREAVVVRHPLQPFDPRNFAPGALHPARSWSFDEVALDGARALEREQRPARGAFLPGRLPASTEPIVDLDELVRFVAHPVRAFLRRRLGIALGDFSTEVDDALPIELDPLARWGVGERMLHARLSGSDSRAAYRAEIARGALPPGLLGKRVIDEVLPTVEEIVAAAEELVGGAVRGSVDVRVALPDGRTLSGTVPGVSGATLATITFSRLSPRQRLAAWVRLLALQAAGPERAYDAVTIGRAPRGDRAAAKAIAPLGPGDALRHLAVLVDLHDRALREPPPLYCRTSAAYAEAAHTGGADPLQAARRVWESEFGREREDRDPEHELVLGGRRTFAELRAEPPREDEHGGGWDPTEPTRFGRWARRLWDPLLDQER